MAKLLPSLSRNAGLLLAAALLLLGVGCTVRKSTTEILYQPQMYHQAAIRPQTRDFLAPNKPGMRVPPAGTVPVGYVPYPLPDDNPNIDNMVNPLPMSKSVLEAGQKWFNTYCIVCHGPRADGLGYIVPHMTQPPPLYLPPATSWSDGHIFYVITQGQGNMPPYRTELTPQQRWAIVHYVRVLQRAGNPSDDDLSAEQQQAIPLSTDFPEAEGPHGPINGEAALPKPSKGGAQ